MSEEARLVAAMRSTVNITSTPLGGTEFGARIVIEMSEETSLFEILAAAWDRARTNPPATPASREDKTPPLLSGGEGSMAYGSPSLAAADHDGTLDRALRDWGIEHTAASAGRRFLKHRTYGPLGIADDQEAWNLLALLRGMV